MKRFSVFIIFYFFIAAANAQGVALQDQNFKVKVLQKVSGERPVNLPDEEIVILGNGISSTFSKKDGFIVAADIATQSEDKSNPSAVTFTAACTNSRNCALKWSCTINNGKIEGKAEKFFTGKLVGEYTFSGALKK